MSFQHVLYDRIEKIQTTLAIKEAEYAKKTDRYHNFHRAAMMQSCTPEQALVGMMAKHWVSIMDMVASTASQNPDEWPSRAMIDEKIGDSINYLILLEGMLLNRNIAREVAKGMNQVVREAKEDDIDIVNASYA
jgi:hypothetical protein